LKKKLNSLFEWLFKTFEDCTRAKKSTSFFTDQAPVIVADIRTQFSIPDIFRGMCTFHINQNIVRNLRSLCDKEFVAEVNCQMFKVDNGKEFEENLEKDDSYVLPRKRDKKTSMVDKNKSLNETHILGPSFSHVKVGFHKIRHSF
ncbi:hypothetical protein LINPERPRIM_LOCUS1399, partial [Linum perenne]